MKGFEDLPDELILEIFSLLDEHTVKCALPRVCKKWKEITSLPLLWQNIPVYLNSSKVPCSVFYPAAIRFVIANSIKSLFCLKNSKMIDALGFDEYDLEGKLKLLEPVLSQLRIVHVSNISFCHINVLFKYLSNVVEFKVLKRSKIPATSIISTCHFSRLKSLQLDITLISPETVKEIVAVCKTNIKSFSAVDRKPTTAKMAELSNLPLKHLEIIESADSNVILSATTISWLSMGHLANLNELHLVFTRLNDKGAQSIRKICKQIQVLEIVKLPLLSSSDQLTDVGILHLLHLPLIKHLEIINHGDIDYFLMRKRWRKHNCDESLPCFDGLMRMLEDWDNREPIIDVV